jgi:hypothetical protein
MLRSSVIGIGLAITVLAFQVGGCSSGGGSGGKGGSAGSSTPGAGGSSTPGAGGSSTPGAGGTSTPGAGGSGGSSTPGAGGSGGSSTPGAGGTAGGTAGSGAGGTAGSGTAGSGAGGTAGSGAGGTAGSGAGGTAGSGAGGTAGSGAGGTAGSGTGGAGGTPNFGLPSCAASVAKNGVCIATDQQLCYKTCGPSNVGRKSETCGPGADGGMTYAEMAGCSYDPAGTYSCYKIPTTANAACPLDTTTGLPATPMGSAACAVADPCVVCNSSGGLAGGNYMDSSGAKAGFCVCVANKWTCASTSAWPCGGAPIANNPGCQ